MPTTFCSKVFCIGRNKTGTTSFAAALNSFGYRLGDQWSAELLIDDWVRRDFNRIVQHCETADAFQDVPFSLDGTYAALDKAFPRSKFVLTVRNNADEWFDSLTRFHTQLIGKDRLPTADDLREFNYHGPGWMWKAHVAVFGVDETSLYDRPTYTRQYDAHIREVTTYFRGRPNDLLTLNLGNVAAMELLCRFLGVERSDCEMPHLNCTRGSAPKAAA